jgi:hypothetical protein
MLGSNLGHRTGYLLLSNPVRAELLPCTSLARVRPFLAAELPAVIAELDESLAIKAASRWRQKKRETSCSMTRRIVLGFVSAISLAADCLRAVVKAFEASDSPCDLSVL